VKALLDAGCGTIRICPVALLLTDSEKSILSSALQDMKTVQQQIEIDLLHLFATEGATSDLLFEKLWQQFSFERSQPADGQSIEKLSHSTIDRIIDKQCIPDADIRAVVRRVVHSTADVSFNQTLRISAGAIESGIRALTAGKPIICDVKMAASGCTHAGVKVHCEISNPSVTALASKLQITRSAAAMEYLRDLINGAIIIIGNAPTALFKVLEMTAQPSGPKPALVIGLPVGFVGAFESKYALSQSVLPFITNLSPRGGSPAAAAALNAVAELAKERGLNA
jgi:precorrin-8X/cobalt-precorrin-8 methylmutase